MKPFEDPAPYISTGGNWATKGAFVWDQSGIRITGIMGVSVCLGAILIPEYLDFHSGYSAPRSRIYSRNTFQNIFRNIFLSRNIPNERALNDQNGSVFAVLFVVCTVLHANLYLFSVRQISSVSSNR